MKNGCYRLDLNDIDIVNPSQIDNIRKQLNKTPSPSGIRYDIDGWLILKSDNIHNIVDVTKNKCWDHRMCPDENKLHIGMKVCVIPTASEKKKYSDIAVCGVLNSLPYEVPKSIPNMWTGD